jgi:vanillate/4-hydroxybenzoate decarboxylase subunit D
MAGYPRPDTPEVYLDKSSVEGKCSNCNEEKLASYPVLSEGGWWNVVKCQSCLSSISRERGPLFGTYQPPGVPK